MEFPNDWDVVVIGLGRWRQNSTPQPFNSATVRMPSHAIGRHGKMPTPCTFIKSRYFSFAILIPSLVVDGNLILPLPHCSLPCSSKQNTPYGSVCHQRQEVHKSHNSSYHFTHVSFGSTRIAHHVIQSYFVMEDDHSDSHLRYPAQDSLVILTFHRYGRFPYV